MKGIFNITYLLLLFWVGSCFISGCQPIEPEENTPDTGCRLQKYTAVIQQPGATQPQHVQATYTYNTQGNLIKADSSWTIAGGTNNINASNSKTTTNYSYNGAGFLISTASNTTILTTLGPGNVETRQSSLSTSFTYANDKLASYVAKSVDRSGLEITVTGSFEYDGAGNLVKQTAVNTYSYDPEVVKEIPGYPTGFERTWIYANKQLTDYIEKRNGTETHPYTIQNGLVIKATYSNDYTLYEYDSQQRLSKLQLFVSNKLNFYYTMEWEEGKPASISFPVLKGFPDLQPAMGYTGIIKTYTFFADYPNNGVVQLTSITSAAQLNGKDFITSLVSDYKDLTPGRPAMTGSGTESFIYTGCN